MARSLLEIHPVRLERLNHGKKIRVECLARHEAKFEAAAEAMLGIDEILDALGDRSRDAAGDRREAIARCLSVSEGWRDAAEHLGGAFAKLGTSARLTGGKE
jgi:hypothetical protein